MKKIDRINPHKVCIVVIYLIISLLLLVVSTHEETETTVYSMDVIWSQTSERLGAATDYRQYFYAPCNCIGIQIGMATDQTEAQKDLTLRIYNSDAGSLLGEHVISHDRIKDNEYVSLMFEDYVLEEGKQYYFEASATNIGENPLRFWMGKTDSRFCLNAQYQGEALPETSIAFNLIYAYTDKNLIIWMFVSVLFLLAILKMTEVEK